MKDKIKGLILGIIIGAIIVSTGVFATTMAIKKELQYDNIKININNVEIRPTDANGNYVEPFTIDGTTYLPVRAIANALGLYVGWDSDTSTVILSKESIPQEDIASEKEVHPIQVKEFGYTVEDEYMHYAIILHNPNKNKAVEYTEIRITARDSSGAPIATGEQTIPLIYPQQDYVYAGLAFEIDEIPAKVDVEVLDFDEDDINDVSMLEYPQFVRLNIKNSSMRDNRIVGEIENNNSYEIDEAMVTVIFRDSNGKLLGGDMTYVEQLKAYSLTPFSLSFYDDFITTNYEIYANLW